MSKKYAKVNVVNDKTQALTEEQQNCDVLCVTMFEDEKDKRIADLEAKLAEKDAEYQSFKKIADENVNYLKNRILEETRNYNKDKISFAVAELEKAKIEFETYYADNIWNYPQNLEDRIAELTHQHEGEKMIKNRCLNCPYNNEGNGCGNDACIQEAVMFDVSIDELKGVHKNEKS